MEVDPDDSEKTREYIRGFWNQHFPIALAVGGDTAYLAIRLAPDDYGAVFYNFSPYYQEDEPPTRVCDSFGELTELFRWAVTRGVREENPVEIYDFAWPVAQEESK